MAVIVYTCDTCRRTVEQVQRNHRAPLFTNCIITQHCKGQLKQIGLDPTKNVASTPESVEGLQDYQQPNRLYVHEQQLTSSQWNIRHDLNSNPIAHVYIPDNSSPNGYRELDPNDYVVDPTNTNHVTIEFASHQIGVAHLVSRSNATFIPPTIHPRKMLPATSKGILTVATPWLQEDSATYQADVVFTDPTNGNPNIIPTTFTAHRYQNQLALFDSPWGQVQLITWNNTLYRVRSIRLSNITTPNNIKSGSPFYIDDPQLIILLSNPPYESTVDTSNRVVIPSNLVDYDSGTRFQDGELQVDDNLMLQYPPGIQIIRTIQDEN